MTRKRVKAIPLTVGYKAKLNKSRINNYQPRFANKYDPINTSSLITIENIPTAKSTAELVYLEKPKFLPQTRKLLMTKKINMPRVRGSRNIFKSMEEKKNFKKLLKNIYGNKSENVYSYWTTHKNNLKNSLRNVESERGKSFSSNNSFEVNTMLNNIENPDFYKQIVDLYGKNYAEFQDYKIRAKRQGLNLPF